MQASVATLETAHELTLKAIEKGFPKIDAEDYKNPEAIGKAIGELYNAILNTITE